MIIIAGTIDLADAGKMAEALERAKPLQQATTRLKSNTPATSFVFQVTA